MRGDKIREGLDKTEFEKNGWQIIILEYNNKMVKGRYEIAKWKDKLSLKTYRKNFIESLTNKKKKKVLPKQDNHPIYGDEEDFGF